jgi:hypothetical protein
MPTKILRLGNTECTLLFIYWMNNKKILNNKYLSEAKNTFIKWLYTTSGYYDKTIKSDYMDAKHDNDDPLIYIKYLNLCLEFIKNCDIYQFCLHKITDNLIFYDEFKNTMNCKKETYISQELVFDFIRDKEILIISPFATLFKQQIDSGNLKNIYLNTPNVKNIIAYNNIYTFFNKGPDNNIFETAEKIFDIIMKNNYNYKSVLISCGAYSIIFAKMFFNIGKNVLTIGGDLQTFFGVLNKRTNDYYIKNNIEPINKQFWITNIPDEFKPENFQKIENGCYW